MGCIFKLKNYISIEDVINYIINDESEPLIKLINENPRLKIKNTYLTLEEATIILLRSINGYTPRKIAELLGVSKSNIYSILKRLNEKIELMKNTLKLCESIEKAFSLDISPDQDAEEIVKEIYRKADEENIKLPLKSIELLKLVRTIIEENKGRKESIKIIIIPGIGIYVK